ncbi:threonine/serine dehydratase [Sphingosinicella sp.]|uniref:threonine ammonia-lyase n=1 Tax=Sphingosinicella sp. TaxID=1917971 RepID=UPI0035B48AA8
MSPVVPDRMTIDAARERIRDLAVRTPLIRLQGGARDDIYLKLETLQPVGSFKIRCAANALLSRGDACRDGVSTASAGNFAQGLAYAGRARGIPVTAYVPDTAARSKVEALERFGASVVTLAYDRWWAMLAEPPADPAFIHPVIESEVLAGNATIGAEILENLPDVATVLVPYGGGGLACGISAALKAHGSAAVVIASETEAGAPVRAAFAAGEPVTVPFAPSFVTGMGGPTVIPAMWPLVRSLVAGTALVSLAETAAAVRMLAERHHVIAEGAGAAPLAAALAGDHPGPVVCIVSGGHLDAAHLATILAGGVP